MQLIISILIAQLAGAIGSIFSATSISTWYANLTKPEFSPPNWLFGPVWIILYTLMGIAAYFIWKKRQNKSARVMLWFYGIHLALNALWSILFFGFKNPFLAYIEIIFLWGMVMIITLRFSKIEKNTGYLFLPYAFWVTFATLLNFTIWMLNRQY